MNFLIIIPDDLGWGDVPWHGNAIPQIYTPHIEALAQSGLRLERFYGNTVCTPARASLFTGKFAFKLGCQQTIWPWSEDGVPLNEKFLSQYLAEAGYVNYQVGKWHIGHYLDAYKPLHRGFHHQFGMLTGCDDYWNHTICNIPDLMKDGKPVNVSGHLTDLFGQKTVDIINNLNADKPFFIYLAFNAPHVPLEPTQQWLNKNPNRIHKIRKDFAAMVSQMDDWIGKIVQTLTNRNLLSNTFIWFRGDNGGWLPYGCTNSPLKGGKISFDEGGIRVPAFVYYEPFNTNKNIWQAMCGEDMLPTICSLAKIPIPQGIDGVDISDYFRNPDLPHMDRVIVHHLINNIISGTSSVITKGDWKLNTINHTLYDTAHDISESSNMIANYPDVAAQIQQLAINYLPSLITVNRPVTPPNNYKYPPFWGWCP